MIKKLLKNWLKTYLLCVNDQEEVDVESIGIMQYKEFRTKHLRDISAFYPSMDAFLLKNEQAKTITEYEKQ